MNSPLDRIPTMRLAPNSIEAEQALLSGILLDTQAWDRVADRLSASDFYSAEHRHIFEAIAEISEPGRNVDAVTVGEHLSKLGRLNQAGGYPYLTELVRDSVGAANIVAYARTVRECAMLRQLIAAAGDIAAAAYEPQRRAAADIVDEAERRILDIADRGERQGTGFKPVREMLEDSMARLQELSENQDAITGVATGFADLDEQTAGFQKGDLVIIAGRPSMGKTALALNIAEFAAVRSRIATGVLSMEMSAEQIMFRLIGSNSRVSQKLLRTGRLSSRDWDRVMSAMDILGDAPIFIDDAPALTPIEVRARARRLYREHDLGLLVVDYLQLMQADGLNENRTTEITRISRSLKSLARELNIPVVALSQLNRSVEQRVDKRPVMSDLRDSGAIEQDADLIVFIYREDVQDRETRNAGSAELIIGKQRNGATGKVRVTFNGKFTRFENFIVDDFGEGVSV